MAHSVSKMPPTNPNTLGKDTLFFMWRKVKALCPNYYIAWFVGFLVYLTANGLIHIQEIVKTFLQCIWELTFVTLSGLIYMRINGVVWYISAMLLTMFLIYPLLRKYYDLFTKVLAPLIAIFLLGYMLKTFGHLRTGTQWLGFTYKGNLRALSEMCIGISIYPLSLKLKKLSLTNLSRTLLSIAEVSGYLGLVICASLAKATKYDFLFLLFLSCSILISFSEQSYTFNFFNNRISFWCGRFSLSLYLSHVYYAKQLPLLFPKWEYDKLFALYWFLAIITGLFVMYTSQFLKKKGPSINQLIKPLFIKQ